MTTPALFRTVSKDNLNFWEQGTLDFLKVREFVGLSTSDVSRIAKVAKSSVRYDQKAPQEVREHMANVANICNLVFEVLQDDVKTKLWLQTPNPMLGNIAPRDMIRLGRYEKLLRFVTQAIEEEAETATGSQDGESSRRASKASA